MFSYGHMPCLYTNSMPAIATLLLFPVANHVAGGIHLNMRVLSLVADDIMHFQCYHI